MTNHTQKDLLPSTIKYILNFGEQHPDFNRAREQDTVEHPEKYSAYTCELCGKDFLHSRNMYTCNECLDKFPY